MGPLVGLKAGRIVTTYFVDAGTKRSRTVVVARNYVVVGCETTFEVRTYWCYEYNEQVFCCRVYTHLRACADEQRTHIEGCTAFVWRYKTLVQKDDFFHHLDELLGWKLWH